MKKDKKNTKAKLDAIKTDLEIKLVKMELKKLKEKEYKLLDNSVVEEKIELTQGKIIEEDKVVKEEVLVEEEILIEKDKVVKEEVLVEEEILIEKDKVVEEGKFIDEDKFLGEDKTAEEDILDSTVPEVEILISGVIEKKEVTVKKGNTKKSISGKKNTVEEKSIKKSNISKKNTVKSQTLKDSTIKKEKKSFFKQYKIIILLLLLLLFAGIVLTFRYVFQLKNELNAKEKELIEKEKEDIDYNPNGYFKDVEDEVNDNDLQDFNKYKDIPELVEDKNTINENESSKNIDTKSNPSTKNEELINENENNDDTSLKINTDIEPKNDDPNESKNDKVENNEEGNITVGYIKVVGLQYVKGDQYIIPKKTKNTDAFKIRIRLDKLKKETDNNKAEIVLVIKNATKKTLKISKREVDFKNDKTVYLIFYEKFKYNLKPNEEYKISVFVNEKLITTTSKTIS